MRLRVLFATVACLAVPCATASAHPQPGGFSFGLAPPSITEDEKLRDLQRAAAAMKPDRAVASGKCFDGRVGPYTCDDVNLLSNLPLAAIGGGEIGNDIWGWTDPETGHEYAIMGKTNGTAFVDVTNGRKPRYLGQMPTQTDGARRFWRDIKVYENHAFVVSEHIGHQMQVFDLTRLRGLDPNAPARTFTADTVYHVGGSGNTHNLDINEESGFAYLVGTSTCNAGLHMVDIRDPKNPTFAGCFGADGYTHDTQCEIYEGPDTRYTGREICFASNEDTVTIVDVTDKSAPVMLSRTGYPTAAYTHQGWLTEDWTHFVFNDELDELFGRAPDARQTTYVLPVQSLTSPGAVMASPNNTTSTDHNLYIRDGWIFESNYTSGLRIFDEDSVPSGDLEEVAYFDVYPENDAPGFEGGTWSNFGEYRGDKVAVSSIDRGLFVLETDLRR